jgi:hypothetical protein
LMSTDCTSPSGSKPVREIVRYAVDKLSSALEAETVADGSLRGRSDPDGRQ